MSISPSTPHYVQTSTAIKVKIPTDKALLKRRENLIKAVGMVLHIDELSWRQKSQDSYPCFFFNDRVSIKTFVTAIQLVKQIPPSQNRIVRLFTLQSFHNTPALLTIPKQASFVKIANSRLSVNPSIFDILIKTPSLDDPIRLRKRSITLVFSGEQHKQIDAILSMLSQNQKNLPDHFLTLIRNCSLLILHPRTTYKEPPLFLKKGDFEFQLTQNLETEKSFLNPIQKKT